MTWHELRYWIGGFLAALALQTFIAATGLWRRRRSGSAEIREIPKRQPAGIRDSGEADKMRA